MSIDKKSIESKIGQDVKSLIPWIGPVLTNIAKTGLAIGGESGEKIEDGLTLIIDGLAKIDLSELSPDKQKELEIAKSETKDEFKERISIKAEPVIPTTRVEARATNDSREDTGLGGVAEAIAETGPEILVAPEETKRGDRGDRVVELQIRLAGFRGTVWDGIYGPGTELQVMTFQRDYMGIENPTGIVDADTIQAFERFAEEFSIDFEKIKCLCGQCGGFGQNRFKGEYQDGKKGIEAYHKYEYPGIHKAILQAFRAAQFYAVKFGFDRPYLTSGYRCWIQNEKKNRESTNHMGKALDIDFPSKESEDKRDDCKRCDNFRGVLVEKSNFQIGWSANNKKALEPSNIAPTWIHMDVRNFSPSYLEDKYFVKRIEELDRF